MTTKPEEITASLRRMADVETSILYSQRTTLIGAADEIKHLQAENATITAAYGDKCDALLDAVIEREELKAENATLRQQLAGSDENALLRHLADIRQKSGVGMKPMLPELADAIADRIAEARNKALDDACSVINKAFSEGSKIPSSTVPMFTGLRTAIRALKVGAP